MADRTTSVAKSVEGLHQEESALDYALVLRNQFRHAQEQSNQKENQRQSEKPHGETEKSGSQMIKEDAPTLKPTPSGPMRQNPDREASGAKLENERAKEAAKLEEARKLRDQYLAQHPSHSRDHDHDRDR